MVLSHRRHYCSGCTEMKEMRPGDMICHDCRSRAEKEKLDAELRQLAEGKTIEQRVGALERMVLLLQRENGQLRAQSTWNMPVGVSAGLTP